MKKRVVFVAIYFSLFVMLLEFCSRLSWSLAGKGTFFDGPIVTYTFYPELREIERTNIEEDQYFDILLLGGSVLAKSHGVIDKILQEKFAYEQKSVVRVYNAAHTAHTSLDSLHKYRRLKDKHFDLVIVYHGINETRTNNCPEEVFRNDYSHYAFYKRVNSIEAHKEINFFTLLYSLRFLWISIEELVMPSHFIHFHQSKQEWVDYGSHVKTAVTFENNIKEIISISKHRKERLILTTFAYHISEKYDKERFLNHDNDYTIQRKSKPIEIWGRVDHVKKGIDVHNSIMIDLAKKDDDLILVDQNKLIPKQGKYYIDVCHFTVEGGMQWADYILDGWKRTIDR